MVVWNPIAEFAGTTLSKSYTWGMDLSGSMQGAGGVGGLLSVHQHSTDPINNSPITDNYFPTYDGNGNVSEYVDATGAVVAHYEYDAFGLVVASGSKANDFIHQFSTKQFSTKQLDSESGLNYYGYRYYDSSSGSWINRDPIGERGGLNVYGFVGNDGSNYIDPHGLRDYPINLGKLRDDGAGGDIKVTVSLTGKCDPKLDSSAKVEGMFQDHILFTRYPNLRGNWQTQWVVAPKNGEDKGMGVDLTFENEKVTTTKKPGSTEKNLVTFTDKVIAKVMVQKSVRTAVNVNKVWTIADAVTKSQYARTGEANYSVQIECDCQKKEESSSSGDGQ